MAEKKITKAAATKAANKAAKAAEVKEAPAKKAPAKKAAAKSSVVYVNAENAGFKAGDVYQALAGAKKAKVAVEEAYLGLGWLLKEGKVATTEDNKVVLA